MFTGDDEANDTTHDEVDTAGEGEAQESAQDEGSAEDTGDSVTLTKAELEDRIKAARKDQDQRWKKRLKVGDDDSDGAEEEGTPEAGDERYDRLELKTEGVTVKEEQDAVIAYAKFKKISLVAALNTPAMKAELRQMRDRAATPSPSRRTGTGMATDSVEHWVAQYKKGGKSAPTVEMRRKVRKALQAGA